MTLTEQFKNGQLKSGWYYVLLFSNEEYIAFIDGNWVVDDRLVESDIKQILARVPAFDEYQQLHKFLEEFNALDVAKENQQLKELLERASYCIIGYRHNDHLPERVFYEEEVSNLLEEINNAIGEKK